MSFKLRIAVPAVLLAVFAGGVGAQPSDAARRDAPPAASGHDANGATAAPASSASATLPGAGSGDRSAHRSGDGSAGRGWVYRSAFDGYRAFTDQPVLSWRESNDLVGRIGGWQAYAREAQGAPAAAASPGTPAAAAPGMPAGHGGMAVPPPASAAPIAPGHHSGHKKP